MVNSRFKGSKSIPTIYDVAAAAGVSIATVSRVLNAPEKVNENTRDIVFAAINQLGFVPKADARARALRDHHRIGVLTPFFTAPSFVQRLRGIATALKGTSYEVVIYSVDSTESVKSYLEILPVMHFLDGLIILSLPIADHLAERLVKYGLETVVVEYPHQNLSSVEIDNVRGGMLAAEYLLKKGYRHIGFVGDTVVPEFGIHPITQRLSGLRQGLANAGLELRPEDLLLVAYDMEATRYAALEFLKRPDRPEAIFSATDLQAVAVMRAARELGLRIPRDLAVLGFDDLDLADYVGLTTVRQHLDESGRVAAELLLARLADRSRSIQHIELTLEIVERETV
ncbi:MAG: LacI family DNA-binding transcriptional regulator [Anaerolineales bacterium]|jgi:LacI family transcriptional regulator